MTKEDLLRSADARVRLEGHAAQQPKHPGAARSTDGIPGEIGHERGQDAETHRAGQAQASGGGQATRRHQDRCGRNGHAQLVRQHVQEEQDLAVLGDDGQNVAHARGLTATPLRRIGARGNWLIAPRAPLPDACEGGRPAASVDPGSSRIILIATTRKSMAQDATPSVCQRRSGARQIKEWITGQIPLTRFGHPDEIAAAVLYLASSESAFVVGTELVDRRRDDPALSRGVNPIQEAQEVRIGHTPAGTLRLNSKETGR